MRGVIAAVLVVSGFVASGAEPSKVKYTYKGREVSEKWIDDRYKEFAGHLARVDGKCFLIWRAQLDGELPTGDVPEVGTPAVIFGKVTAVKGETITVWAKTQRNDELPVRVEGSDAPKIAEGTDFHTLCVYAGVDRTGGRAVSLYVVPGDVTKLQFAEALRDGLKLSKFAKVKEKRGTIAPGFGGGGGTAVVEVVKETPVP